MVRQYTGEIQDRLRRTAQDIWEIGQRLANVRDYLQHGQFDAWLKAEFGWSRRTAYNFINVYESFEEQATLQELDIATSALYLLAAPSTPQSVRKEYLEKAQSGEKLTHKDLKQALHETKPKHSQAKKEESRPTGSVPKSTGASTTPEIIAVIPRATVESQQLQLQEPCLKVAVGDGPMENVTTQKAIAPLAPANTTQPTLQPNTLQPGWYLLENRHFLFCGDTASPKFYRSIPEAAFALAATSNDWDHDWLVDAATTVLILPETLLQGQPLERSISLYSQPNDVIIFPWLPHPEMIATAHQLNRKIFAGDQRPERCYQAIVASGLTATAIKM
ncbi:MAG: DUF3102 domain-containing protein [Cyanothece sp. SIO2G6]|nr:DUF3102 domain-containing protein [Cyanothece sp. SIO2G6]